MNFQYDIKPVHRRESEPLWYNILSEWSARPPLPRKYRKYHYHEDITMWLREMWHAVNEKDRRIAALEAALEDAIEWMGGDACRTK